MIWDNEVRAVLKLLYRMSSKGWDQRRKHMFTFSHYPTFKLFRNVEIYRTSEILS